MNAPLRWPAEALWEAVVPLLPGFTVEVLPSVDSTNTELMRRARAGHVEPILLVAEQQTAGRGRMGRVWHSRAGDSLTFSLGLPLAPRDWSGLSLAVGVSVAESLQPVLPPQGAPAGVGPAGAGRYVVVGIGLNVRPQSGEGMSLPPGSLQEVDAGLDAPAALLRMAAPLVCMLQAFAGYGFAPMQPRFALRDVLQGRSVQLSDGTRGEAHGVGADGALLVHTAGGMQSVTSSEISVRPFPAVAPSA